MRLAYLLFLVAACAEHGSGGFQDAPGTGGDGGSGTQCGGFTAMQCAADEWCDFARNSCGATDESGVCRKRPVGGCDDILQPTCGCDGVVHDNACLANVAGTDADAFGMCPVPPGKFACGFTQCALANEYCQHSGSDIGNEPDGFVCKPVPATCPSQTPSCSCLTAEPCGTNCAGSGATGLTVTCLGG